MGPCYWCKESTIICPDCLSVYGEMESCGLCKGTGAICEKRHGAGWQGSVPCPPELEEGIDNWLRYHIRDPWDDGPTIEDFPARGVDALSYIAFMADLNAANPSLFITSEGEAAIRWLTRCRNVAIEAGGSVPNVVRGEPLPAQP